MTYTITTFFDFFMETFPRDSAEQEHLPNVMQRVRSFAQRYKFLLAMALMGTGGCAHMPHTQTDMDEDQPTMIDKSKPETQQPAQEEEDPCENRKMIRRSYKHIWYRCKDGTVEKIDIRLG